MRAKKIRNDSLTIGFVFIWFFCVSVMGKIEDGKDRRGPNEWKKHERQSQAKSLQNAGDLCIHEDTAAESGLWLCAHPRNTHVLIENRFKR